MQAHLKVRECSLARCLSLPLALSPRKVVGQMGHVTVGCWVCLLSRDDTSFSWGWDLLSSLFLCLGRSLGWDLLWGWGSLPLGWGLLERCWGCLDLSPEGCW